MNKKELKENIIDFYDYKQQDKDIKTKSDDLNTKIKDGMKSLGLTEFKEDGYIAKYAVQKRNTVDEKLLVEKLKQLNLTNAIRTVEIPDSDVVEDLIYNGKLDPKILSSCTSIKEVEVLKISYKPPKK